MSMEYRGDHEVLPGEFEFKMAFGALKAQFMRAVEEQKGLDNYLMYLIDTVDGVQGQVARIRLIDRRFMYDLQNAAQDPDAIIDVGLPLAIADTENPVLFAESPMHEDQLDQFVLYDRESDEPIIVDATHMQELVLDNDPRFLTKAFDSIPIPIRKTVD